MAVNDSCRLCERNLRVNGIIGSCKLIFDKKDNNNVSTQLSKLGLTIENTPLRSFRVCRSCCSTISRLLCDTETFRKWKEKEAAAATVETASTDKTEREPTPSKTPKVLKKYRISTDLGMPTRTSVTEVTITYDPGFKKKIICKADIGGIVENLAKRNFTRAANLVSRHKELMTQMLAGVADTVEAECKALCNPENRFMLWGTSADVLQTFSFLDLYENLKQMAPFLTTIMARIAKDSVPHICTAASVALRAREPRMSALAYYVSSVLLSGRSKKAMFRRLAKLGISTIYQLAIDKHKELANSCTIPVVSLETDLECFFSCRPLFTNTSAGTGEQMQQCLQDAALSAILTSVMAKEDDVGESATKALAPHDYCYNANAAAEDLETSSPEMSHPLPETPNELPILNKDIKGFFGCQPLLTNTGDSPGEQVQSDLDPALSAIITTVKVEEEEVTEDEEMEYATKALATHDYCDNANTAPEVMDTSFPKIPLPIPIDEIKNIDRSLCCESPSLDTSNMLHIFKTIACH